MSPDLNNYRSAALGITPKPTHGSTLLAWMPRERLGPDGALRGYPAERVRWTEEEDNFILSNVKAGLRDWDKLAKSLSGMAANGQTVRTPDAIRNHWHRLIKTRGPFQFDKCDAEPAAVSRCDRHKWSETEDEIILLAVEELGRSWRQVAKRLPPCKETGEMRSDSSVRNRWERLMSKRMNANEPSSCGSSLIGSLPETGVELDMAPDPPPLSALAVPIFDKPLSSLPVSTSRYESAGRPAMQMQRARYDLSDSDCSHRRSWRSSEVEDELSFGLRHSLSVTDATVIDAALPAPMPTSVTKASFAAEDAEQFAANVFAALPAAAPTGGELVLEPDELLSIVGTFSPAEMCEWLTIDDSTECSAF